ncbi:MAG: CHAT domain-containing protein [Chlorogloeopsis fritschii C42_A2020_084]|uniref:CHAT domain-containing protein n=1 Tax=Chlorogloeopsis fritschii TaxID=1124 RepID=UPI0019FC4638|nr:CHAT domain-containing protein [Chlorogloeopsis fritschii]MBF2009490.1 CHAT domain-containing protein [Chlorogloeopsis fritschii C42_A2020_084]
MKKILILSVNPKNTENLRLDEEVREIQIALKLATHRAGFEIVTQSALRVDDLRRALLEHQPTIVHFCGHGAGTHGLVLENNSGQMQLVSTESLARLFKSFQEDIECVLLNACYSETQAAAIHQHIDCVIGMNQPIGDKAAIKFAVGFYDGLGAGRTYEACFELGCASLDLEGIAESETPVIKVRRRQNQTQPQANLAQTEPIKSPTRDEMSQEPKGWQNRSVSVGGKVIGSAITTGDNNVTSVHYQPVSLPAPESVDMRAEINTLREILVKLESSDRRKIDNAFADVEEELNKPQPDKNEVGKALDRAFDYAKKAEGFVSLTEKLKPHLTKTVAWLGENWHNLLNIVGLTN